MADSSSMLTGVRDMWREQTCVQEHQHSQLRETEILDLDLKEIKKEADSILQKEHRLRNASKPHSTPLTLKWLDETYEIAEGVCIPRSALYLHYLDFCEKNDSQPVNAASFGKIIRQQFPQLTTRRLGTRGQSKYHYYGIGIKETSPYYEVMYSKNGVQSNIEGRKENIRQIVTYSPRCKMGTLLPPFPEVKDLNLPEDMDSTKVCTFMMMYRTHCQRILDTVIRANFDEVESFLLHFWQGMPQHIIPVLETPVLVNLVGVCDCILYKTIASVLMPTVLQALPDSLAQVIRKFSRQLDDWLKAALQDLPETLINMKFDLSRRFAQVLRRQTSLNQLCQAARTVIHSGDIVCQMLDDWSHVDLSSICKQTLYTMDRYSEADHRTIIGLYKEFEQLLEEQSPLEAYTEWLDSIVDRCIVRPSLRKAGTLRKLARQFLLMWSCFGTRVIRDMTLHSAPSFGSFHLLHLMFDDYVLYVVENLHTQERANDLLRIIRGELSPEEAHHITCSRTPIMLSGVTQPYYYNSCSQRQSVITGYGALSQAVTSPVTSHSGSCDVSQSAMTSALSTTHESANQSTESSQSSQMCNQNTYNHGDYYSQNFLPYCSYGNYNSTLQKSSCGSRGVYKNVDWMDPSGYYKSQTNSQHSGGACELANSDNSLNTLSDYNSQTYTQINSGDVSRMNSHVQQGVIYSPYHSNSYYSSDNNNLHAKRKLDDENKMAAKRLTNQDVYITQQSYQA